MKPLSTLLSEAMARLQLLRERQVANVPHDPGVPFGVCVRPGHPHECAADPEVGCVRWREAPKVVPPLEII